MPAPDVRIPCVRRCVVQRGSQQSDAVLHGLGVAGACVTFLSARSSLIPQEGEIVALSFGLPGDPEAVEARAQVTGRHACRESIGSPPKGCEVRFLSLRAEDEGRLHELIEDYQTRPHPRIAVPPPHSGVLRIPYVEPCLIVGEDATWEGVACNLSVLGAYVASVPSPAVGRQVRLFMKMPGKADPLELACEVAWTRTDEQADADGLPPGCGLRFLDEAGRGEIELLLFEYESLPRIRP